MKRILIIIIAVVYSTSLRAEYNGYHITLSIENAKGQISKGYVYVASAYLNTDSLNNSEYLKKALDQSCKDWDKRDRLTYFKERIKYEYTTVWDNSWTKNSIYYLTGKTVLSFKSIKNIKIEEMIDFGYTQGIANELKLSDTTWMKREPLNKVSFGGYLHSYQIFIHENSPKINEIIKQLEIKQKEIDNTELQDDNGDTDYRKGDKIDEELWEIIKKLNKFKVVIIAESSC
jgi:hypothetical protein